MSRIIEPTGLTLKGINAFRHLDAQACDDIAKQCSGRSYNSGEEVVRYTDPTDDVYFLVSGTVRATIYTLSGKEVAFRDLSPGELFGDLSALDGEPRCATIKALEDCAMVTMGASQLEGVILAYPRAALEMMREMASLIRLLTERTLEISTLDVASRVCSELVRLSESSGSRLPDNPNHINIERPPTHEAIANRINTHREAVTKALSRLERDHVIVKSRGTLIILDIDGLRRRVLDAQIG